MTTEQTLGSFSAFLFTISDDRFFVADDLRAALTGRNKLAWTVIVTTQRVILRLRHRREDLTFAYDVNTVRFERAAKTPGSGFLDLGSNNIGIRPATGAALLGIETSLRMAHGEPQLFTPARQDQLDEAAFGYALQRARRRRRIRRFVTTIVIVGALTGGNALYQSHQESDFKQRCAAAGGAQAIANESLFDFSGTCYGPGLAGVLFTS